MYSVAIADDEIGIREGLRDLVDWRGLGFSLAGTFEDGEELLPLLKSNPPDLLVTDIRMNRCSGLEVAKYIQEHGLKTKVVLISGYKEADLAMSAIRYGVKDYVLKPVDLDELIACIQSVRSQLDAEQAAHARQEELDETCNKMQDLLKLFFEEMMRGALQNQRLVRRMFSLIYPELSFEQSACFFLTLHIRQNNHFVRNQWARSRSELPGYINGFAEASSRRIETRIISERDDQLLVFGLLRVQSDGTARAVVEEDIAALCNGLRTAFGVQVDTDGLEVFSSIPAMLGSIAEAGPVPLACALEQLSLRQKQFYASLLEPEELDDRAAVQAAEYFSSYLAELDLSLAKEVAKNFLYPLSSRLRVKGIPPMASLTLDEAFPALDKAEDCAALRTVLLKTTRSLFAVLHGTNNDLVERTKDYVFKHIGKDLSLEDISDHFYLSPSHFSRTFKAQAGETLIRFVSRCKMEYAAHLLASTDLKIYDVCEQVGYKSLRHFNKLFKAYTGMQPSGYRQRMHMGGIKNER